MTETRPAETSPIRTGRKTRQRPGQDRRQALVEAAYRRIAECGFEGLRLRDVAAEVGIDHSTIHHYFPTKQALVTAVVDYAFGPLDLRRLEADIDPRNQASLRALERIGFTREGLLRERWQVGDEISDTVFLGLLARDWRARRATE